jgi:hypothetical protein
MCRSENKINSTWYSNAMIGFISTFALVVTALTLQTNGFLTPLSFDFY